MAHLVKWLLPILVLSLIAAPVDAKAKSAKKKAHADLKGTIVSVSGGDLTIKTKASKTTSKKAAKSAKPAKSGKKAGKKGKTAKKPGKVIHTSSSTSVTVNGKAASVKSLHAGQKVKISLDGKDTAKSIAAKDGKSANKTPKKAKKNKA